MDWIEDNYDSDSDEEERWNEAARRQDEEDLHHHYEQQQQEEERRELLQRQEQERAVREEAAPDQQRFRAQTRELVVLNVGRYGSKSQALAALQTLPSNCCVFARDKPTLVNKHGVWKRKNVKEYLVGSPMKFFNYMTRAAPAEVNLDEVILATRQARMCFDLEVKKQKGDELDAVDLEEILRGHMAIIGDRADASVVASLAREYRTVAVSDFTEEQCWAGLKVLHNHIMEKLSQICSQDFDELIGPDCELQYVTGCRPSKFSLHVVSRHIYCDSPVVSMVLIVFEIARTFVEANTLWLVSHQSRWESDEGRFRIRALMLLESIHPDRDEEEGLVFKGVDDSPFDEGIYDKDHLLRVPGACKLGSDAGALAPVNGYDSQLMTSSRNFCDLYPMTETGYACWMSALINGPVVESVGTDNYVITGWKPTLSFGRKGGWMRDYHSYQVTEGELRRRNLVVVSGRVGMPAEYLERRTTRIRLRALSRQEMNWASFDPSAAAPKEPISLDQRFRYVVLELLYL